MKAYERFWGDLKNEAELEEEIDDAGLSSEEDERNFDDYSFLN
jgi:hypothetical protein